MLRHLPDRRSIATMKITEALLAEHLVFHHMFDHLEAQSGRLETLAQVKFAAALLESMLKTHSDTEDALFLGPLEHCFEQIGQRDRFVEEHREVDGTLRQVQRATRLTAARELLMVAIAYSRRHFDREERIIFPMAERMLKSRTLTELGRKWMEQRDRVAK